MIKILGCIVLAPIAVSAAVFSAAIIVGAIKGIAQAIMEK
jgi:hypothetical protein